MTWNREGYLGPTSLWYAFPHLLVARFGWPTVLTRQGVARFLCTACRLPRGKHAPFCLAGCKPEGPQFFFRHENLLSWIVRELSLISKAGNESGVVYIYIYIYSLPGFTVN